MCAPRPPDHVSDPNPRNPEHKTSTTNNHPNSVKRQGPYIISRILISGPETWELVSRTLRFYLLCVGGEFPELLYNNGRTYLLRVIFVHAPCFQHIVRACECKQPASNVPAGSLEKEQV